MMKTVFLFLFTVFLTSARADIVCQNNGQGWVPMNNKVLLGLAGFSFGKEKECKEANPDKKAVAACNWNGYYYSMYSVTDGSSFEKANSNYSTAKDCAEAVAYIKNGKMCLWNNKNWQPFNVSTRLFTGKLEYGFREQKECRNAISGVPEGYACNWNGSYYSIYDATTNTPFDGIEASYSTVKDCENAVVEVKSGKICLWNNQNWQPFSIRSRKFLGIEGFGFNARKACIDSLSESSEEYTCNWNGTDYSLYSASNPTANNSAMTFVNANYCSDYIKRLKTANISPTPLTESELRTLFYPKPVNVGYTYGDCQDPALGHHLVKRDALGVLPDSCIPDTLYSWGDYGKVIWFRDRYEKSGNWNAPFERDLFATQSPVATFGYGPVPLRFKLKAGTKAKVSTQNSTRRTCKSIPDDEKVDTILINHWQVGGGTGVDYVICSMGPVESWSYGTKQHYDEIIRDLNWIETHDYIDYELYYKKAGVDLFFDNSLDGHEFSRNVLWQHLRNVRQLIDLELGGVFHQNSAGKEAQHFKTKLPIYYNAE
jgi:hypothetical protein